MNPQTLHHPIEYIQQKLLNEECYVYVLIDVNSHQILRGELFNQNDAPIFRSLFHGTLLQELRDQAPYLVQIELNQYQYLRYLLEQSPEHFMLFFSEHEIDILYQHWQSLLTVYALDGDVAIYKLYSPQILGPYLDACKTYEQARLLAFCEALYLYDEQDEWALTYQADPALAVPLSELKTLHPQLKTAWWHLKEHHLIYLQHITEESLRSNMEDYLTEHCFDLLLAYQGRDINQMIRHGIRRGRHYGIKTRRDFAFYLGMMFDVGPNFDEHPRVQKWLYQWDKKCEVGTIADELPEQVWVDAHNQYDDTAWQKMQKDYVFIQPEIISIEEG